jgi:hypothetical protein
MPVLFASEPPGCRSALTDGLNALGMAPTPASRAHLAAVAGSQAPPPLPVYSFPLDDLAPGKDPMGNGPVAWKFLLVIGSQPIRTADVVPAPGGGYQFASISAAQAPGIDQAILAAENSPVLAKGRYELRLVEVPALYVTALWLKTQRGKADYFIVIPPAPDGFQPYAVTAAPGFRKLLRAAAAQRSPSLTRQQGGPSQTN